MFFQKSRFSTIAAGIVFLAVPACGNSPQSLQGAGQGHRNSPQSMEGKQDRGQIVQPPFAVTGNVEGPMLTWFDDEGLHVASNREEVPPAHRSKVRVDSLDIPPSERLPPNKVYVADLSKSDEDGNYTVRVLERSSFESWVADAQAKVALATNDVIIYGADWCGACRAAARYFREQNIPFVEKNIEKDPGARREMKAKAKAAGVRTSGIPVIDFRGTLLAGFDVQRIQALMAQGKRTTL